jgi:hypothetical protein
MKCVHAFYGTCFQYNVKNLRIDQLTPLLVVAKPYACWFSRRTYYIEDFKVASSFSIQGCILKGCFEREYILKGQSRV